MNIKTGDEIFLTEWVYIGFSQRLSWKKAVVTRITKTLIFVEDIKFRKCSLGVDLFEINDETLCRATEDNSLLRRKELQIKFSVYKWQHIELETLEDINNILLLAEITTRNNK